MLALNYEAITLSDAVLHTACWETTIESPLLLHNSRRIRFGLQHVHSPLLMLSFLVSFLALSYKLKFSAYSCLVQKKSLTSLVHLASLWSQTWMGSRKIWTRHPNGAICIQKPNHSQILRFGLLFAINCVLHRKGYRENHRWSFVLFEISTL